MLRLSKVSVRDDDSLSSCAEDSSSVQGARKRKKLLKEKSSDSEEQLEEKMSHVRKERENLEQFLFNENNKVARPVIKFILSKWCSLESKLQDVIMENEKLKVKLACQESIPSPQRTYAQVAGVVSSGDPHFVPGQKEPETKKRIKVKNKLRVRSLRQMRKKGLVVEVDGKSDVEMIRKSNLEKVGLVVEEPRKQHPAIVIFDVEKDYKVEELKEDFIFKNCGIENEDELNKFMQANWEKFNRLICEHITLDFIKNLEQLNANNAVKQFMLKINEICKNSIPRKGQRNNSVPWWSDKLSLARSRVNKMKKELSRARRLNLCDQIEYMKRKFKENKNRYVAMIRRSKKESWRNFVNTVGNNNPWGIVYKIVRDKIHRSDAVCSVVTEDGDRTISWKETMITLLNKMVPSDDKTAETNVHTNIRAKNAEYKNHNLEQDISETEISDAIRRCKNGKAPGLDGMKIEIIKKIWTFNKDVISTLLNHCFRNSSFPKVWKNANLKILLKGTDRDRVIINSYRPIALLSSLGKIYERIIISRIEQHYQ
ncbi:hypothetical protein KPH14_000718, partial [Odynerus spinipes]